MSLLGCRLLIVGSIGRLVFEVLLLKTIRALGGLNNAVLCCGSDCCVAPGGGASEPTPGLGFTVEWVAAGSRQAPAQACAEAGEGDC